MGAGKGRYRIGFDIGGTFTDFILWDGEARTIGLHKCLTSADDPSQAALAGLEELVAMASTKLADVAEIVHGTTLVTNAIIERRGARIGLLTTAGFRDILEMGTEQRYDIYALFLQFPEPLVARRHRLEVVERIDRDGRIVTALDRGSARDALRRLRQAGIEAVAVAAVREMEFLLLGRGRQQRLHGLGHPTIHDKGYDGIGVPGAHHPCGMCQRVGHGRRVCRQIGLTRDSETMRRHNRLARERVLEMGLDHVVQPDVAAARRRLEV